MSSSINPLRTQSAIVGTASGELQRSRNAPIPEAKDDIVIIRTKALSVNPVDAKMVGPYLTAGAILGCDAAGIVEEIGPAAAQHGNNIKVGDRVLVVVMGMNPLEPALGAFAEHIGARPISIIKLPDTVSFESGSALGTSFMTAGLALFKSLNLPGYPLAPASASIPVLIYGGSTATGTAAIQLLRLAGFTPIVTCSPHNFDLVRSYGAGAVFDYRAPDCVPAIKSLTRNGLRYALDCITTTESTTLCYQALGRAGGMYTALDPFSPTVAATRKLVKADWALGPTMLGKDIGWPAPHGRPADANSYEFAVKWTATVQDLLNRGLIREHVLLEQSGGLEGVLDGIGKLKAKTISGKKLVYRLES